MNRAEFIDELCDILETDHLDINEKVTSSGGWDSLARLSIIILIKENFNIKLDNSNFTKLTTIGDILELIDI